ncbi:related to UDP-N-acetylglucosamine transferase subunit alg13 [Ramularia collo-cygni]|uniref:UDP-N-acetylglucosamine transferase subunit ALG13 n=1 Tax=Ramularia collo-cygni TaxID=112498 RepID=A0A2D3V6H0_9PEZI|nr:related to UDP-N-acetylglucosamine transferase subunit alg13 [Ramularia collo-cygni]CZT22295.1 related to UDP-N-acetylglucosamine transferase subunit alg13 [Ramularia collo-cygni]
MPSNPPQSGKTCFVTIGATASFTGLIKATLTPDFLAALESHGYTELLVQYGQGGKELFDGCCAGVLSTVRLHIHGFDLDQAGLGPYMLRAKGGQRNGREEGVVISHAGSGTILDALRISVPIIVVPNSELLDNHQVELAEALAEQEYVVHGRLEELSRALQEASVLAQRYKAWPPVNSGVHREVMSLKSVLDDEMGYLD